MPPEWFGRELLYRATIIAMLIVLAGAVAHAQTIDAPAYMQAGSDEYQLRQESEDMAVLEYLNDSARASNGWGGTLQDGEAWVTLSTTINIDGERERVTVDEVAPGWIAEEYHVDVADGERGVIVLRRGLFMGM